MTTVGFSGILGLWLIGSVPSALLLILPGIAIYFLAKRSGPAAGALSALFSLGLLSVVPILALTPLPKWWTVQWVSANSAGLPIRGGLEVQYPPSASDRPLMAPASLVQVAQENRTASLPAVPPPEPSQSFANRSRRPVLPWSVNWEQATRLTGILLAAGWSLSLIRFALGLRTVAQFRTQSQEITDLMACDVARSIANQLGFPGPIRLRQTNGVASAATIGWMHPVILLPANWESWTPEELRVVLAHEIGHIVRRDYLAWVLAQLSLALHIYHPLAHWLVSRLRRDQELAADLLGSEVCGGREQYLVTLSQLVLRQTTRSAPRLSCPVFSVRGTFLWRMKMLHAKRVSGSSRLRRLPVSLLAILTLLIALGSAGVGISFADQPNEGAKQSRAIAWESGKIIGRITAADTGKPVEGAKVRIFVVAAQGLPWWLDLISDKEGWYSRDLPLGHCALVGVYAPPGYYIQDEKMYTNFALTKKDPGFVRDFSLQSGDPWKIELAGYAGAKGRHVGIEAERDQERPLGERFFTEANAQGDATLTLPRVGGTYKVRCDQSLPVLPFEIPSIELKLEEGFDPTRIQGDLEANAADRSIRMKDGAGKIATVSGAEVRIRNGHATLRIQCKPTKKSAAFKIEGVVQTEKGEPILGAKVNVAVNYTMENMNVIGTVTNIMVNSSENGKFSLQEVCLNSNDFRRNQQVTLIVEKPGFESFETEKLNLADIEKSGIANFGAIKLKPGKILYGRVLDEKGNPVQGALVNCTGGMFFYRYLACRSDAQGRFQFPDLSFGQVSLSASFGDQTGNEAFAFDKKSGELTLALHPLFIRRNPAPAVPRLE